MTREGVATARPRRPLWPPFIERHLPPPGTLAAHPLFPLLAPRISFPLSVPPWTWRSELQFASTVEPASSLRLQASSPSTGASPRADNRGRRASGAPVRRRLPPRANLCLLTVKTAPPRTRDRRQRAPSVSLVSSFRSPFPRVGRRLYFCSCSSPWPCRAVLFVVEAVHPRALPVSSRAPARISGNLGHIQRVPKASRECQGSPSFLCFSLSSCSVRQVSGSWFFS